jgi:hypothetical protein
VQSRIAFRGGAEGVYQINDALVSREAADEAGDDCIFRQAEISPGSRALLWSRRVKALQVDSVAAAGAENDASPGRTYTIPDGAIKRRV